MIHDISYTCILFYHYVTDFNWIQCRGRAEAGAARIISVESEQQNADEDERRRRRRDHHRPTRVPLFEASFLCFSRLF